MIGSDYDIAHETPEDAEMFGLCDEPDCDGAVFWCEACEKWICESCDHWHKDLERRSDV
jgi:hypothetical protein